MISILEKFYQLGQDIYSYFKLFVTSCGKFFGAVPQYLDTVGSYITDSFSDYPWMISIFGVVFFFTVCKKVIKF